MTIQVQVILRGDGLQAEPVWHWRRIAHTDHQITTFGPEDPYVNYHKTIYPLPDIYSLEMNDGRRTFQVLKRSGRGSILLDMLIRGKI
jgi:hypothetical protein